MRFAISLCLAALALLPAGCSTMNQIDAQAEGPAAFGGVRYTVARWEAKGTTPGDQAAMFLDLPLSFALDLVIMPFSALNEIVAGGIDVTPEAPAIERPR